MMADTGVATVCQQKIVPHCKSDWTMIGDSCYKSGLTLYNSTFTLSLTLMTLVTSIVNRHNDGFILWCNAIPKFCFLHSLMVIFSVNKKKCYACSVKENLQGNWRIFG